MCAPNVSALDASTRVPGRQLSVFAIFAAVGKWCVASTCGQFSIVTVSRCADRATYDPDAEKAADEVPIVFKTDERSPDASRLWSERVKAARRSWQRFFAYLETEAAWEWACQMCKNVGTDSKDRPRPVMRPGPVWPYMCVCDNSQQLNWDLFLLLFNVWPHLQTLWPLWRGVRAGMKLIHAHIPMNMVWCLVTSLLPRMILWQH